MQKSTLTLTLLFSLFFVAAGVASAGDSITLTVDADTQTHSISENIYGLNFTSDSYAAEIDLPFKRWGGNSRERYNFQINAHNAAEDYFFRNLATYDPHNFSAETADDWVQRNLASQTRSGISLPLVGWVSKDSTACSYPQAQFPNQNGYNNDCGDGHTASDYLPITTADPTLTSVAVDASFITDWVTHLKTTNGDDAVGYYYLGNEPSLWSETHFDVHPEPQTYAELRDRSIAYAAAVKAADPNAQVLGPTSFNYSGYFYSRADEIEAASNGYTARSDFDATGLHQVPYFLTEMAQYEQVNGTRILDYLDLHYYPNNVALTTAGDTALQAQRLRATRGLWDPSYRDEGWIGSNDQAPDFRQVRLIPRMQGWVNDYYPGMKLSIGEYDFGAHEHINGALAQIDVLGIFGREQVDIATHWNYPDTNSAETFYNQPIGYAFRMYRNYDGNGGKFGDTSVTANSSDQGQLSVYAATRDDGALTVMVVNKAMATISAELDINSSSHGTIGQVHRYSAADLDNIEQLADATLTRDALISTYPADSATLYVFNESTPTSVQSLSSSTDSGLTSWLAMAGALLALMSVIPAKAGIHRVIAQCNQLLDDKTA